MIFSSAFFYGCSSVPLDYSSYENINFQEFGEMNKNRTHVLINLAKQELTIKTPYSSKTYPISSSAYGIGSVRDSLKTPLGAHIISEKIGKGAKLTRILIQNMAIGSTFHNLENFDLHKDSSVVNVECFLGSEQSRIETKGNLLESGANFENFSLFSLSLLESFKKLFWYPDIIICNDWQTSILPILLKNNYSDFRKMILKF